LTEWTNCTYQTQSPERIESFQIPQEFKDECPLLKEFKFETKKRIFEKSLEELESFKRNPEDLRQKQPLYGLEFTIAGKLKKKYAQIKILVERLGGKLSTNVESSTIAVISNVIEVEKATKKITDAEEYGIHIVDEEFLNDLDKRPFKQSEIETLILKHNLIQWGTDFRTRMNACIDKKEKNSSNQFEKKFAIKSAIDGTSKIRMKVKGGAAIDPDTGLDDEAHVLCEARTNDPYSCVLGLVDILQGTNSYYKLQIIEHDTKSK